MSKNIIIGLVLAVILASSLALFGKHQYDMGVQTANFQERLVNFFSASPQKQTQ